MLSGVAYAVWRPVIIGQFGAVQVAGFVVKQPLPLLLRQPIQRVLRDPVMRTIIRVCRGSAVAAVAPT